MSFVVIKQVRPTPVLFGIWDDREAAETWLAQARLDAVVTREAFVHEVQDPPGALCKRCYQPWPDCFCTGGPR
jgi:hypothetical protein